jgi:S1-C subfamily serine protease
VNLFDAVVLVLLVVAVVIGIGSGALPQVGGLLGAFGGGGLAILALPLIESLAAGLDPGPRAVAVLVAILGSIGLGEGIGSAIGRLAGRRLGQGVLSSVDRVLGGVVGAAQALLVVWLVGGVLAAGPLRFAAAQAQTSFVVRALNAVLPAPTEFAGELGRLLDDTGIPDLFIGLEPLPAPPVELPADPEARAIAAKAEPSTVRISALTCEFVSSGSGFVVARGYVVTNAHVIAGARTVRVRASDGSTLDAVAVYDDPELDVALLWVAGLQAPALRFASAGSSRGAAGAALGFPHGGSLRAGAAAVTGSYDAQGRDIYGDNRVVRRILELQADVQQGDSGGPFVLEDGTVGGVVFAEARTNDRVGYALTATSVGRAIGPSVGRTGRVDTGGCIH